MGKRFKQGCDQGHLSSGHEATCKVSAGQISQETWQGLGVAGRCRHIVCVCVLTLTRRLGCWVGLGHMPKLAHTQGSLVCYVVRTMYAGILCAAAA
eukprot:3169766-Amphidinium_carterae.1